MIRAIATVGSPAFSYVLHPCLSRHHKFPPASNSTSVHPSFRALRSTPTTFPPLPPHPPIPMMPDQANDGTVDARLPLFEFLRGKNCTIDSFGLIAANLLADETHNRDRAPIRRDSVNIDRRIAHHWPAYFSSGSSPASRSRALSIPSCYGTYLTRGESAEGESSARVSEAGRRGGHPRDRGRKRRTSEQDAESLRSE